LCAVGYVDILTGVITLKKWCSMKISAGRSCWLFSTNSTRYLSSATMKNLTSPTGSTLDWPSQKYEQESTQRVETCMRLKSYLWNSLQFRVSDRVVLVECHREQSCSVQFQKFLYQYSGHCQNAIDRFFSEGCLLCRILLFITSWVNRKRSTGKNRTSFTELTTGLIELSVW